VFNWKNTLQSLTRGSLRVDGKRELVHDDDEDEDDGGEGGGKGDVPTLDGSPGEGLSDGSGLGNSVDGGGSNNIGGGRIDELAARSINAVLGVVLEGADDSDVDEEGDDHGDQDDGSEENSDHTGEGHADSEDELVADAVKEEGEEDNHEDEGGQEGDENESLGGLGDVAELGGEGVVLEVGGADGSGDGDHSLDSVEVVVDLGRVDLVGRGSKGRSRASTGGGGGGLEVKGLLELVPGGDGSSDHEGEDDRSEHDRTAVSGVEGSAHI